MNIQPHSRLCLTWDFLVIRFPYLKVTGFSLSSPQKIVIVSVSIGFGLLGILARYMRRRKRNRIIPPKLDTDVHPKRYRPGIRSPNGDILSGFHSSSPVPQRSHRTRSSSVTSDRYSAVEAVNPKTALSPQQLGTMGVESLEAAINYWEDALESYQSGSTTAALPTVEEAEFCRHLERVLKAAYVLQDETEHLFLHQHSVLFQSEFDALGEEHPPYSRSSVSFTSVDSFLSAQGDVADLQDFSDLPIDESQPLLYQGSLKQLDEHGIPCRVLRTELVGCESDIEYLCKLHCVRLACQALFHNNEARQWFAQAGRNLLSDLVMAAKKDPQDVLVAYDAMLEFVLNSSQRSKMAVELEGRGVRAMTFFDVVLDFILMDAFEDLTTPPSSVVAVINNRWLSTGFKEGALATAVWSVLKAKRRKLMYPDGFIAHFYDISEHLSPILAWGFLGPESELKSACLYFKDQVIGFLEDIFNFDRVRYTSVEEMAADVWTAARRRCDCIAKQMTIR